MKKTLTLTAAFLTLLLVSSPAARAGLILQPASATTDMGNNVGFTVPNNVRNQSGLSAGYTSLVTDFDGYIATNPTHNSVASSLWASALGTLTGNFDFDLGGTFTIESLALWNIGGNLALNLIGFDLLASADAAFTSPISLGSFSADPNTGLSTAVLPEVFTFAPTSAAFVRIVITSNNGSTISTGFKEAAFEVSAVPEPSSLLLMAMGAISLGGTAWRKRNTATKKGTEENGT